MANRAPLAVLVVGPHRSGTSCVTEVIHTLGFRLGRDLLGERPDNPRGLWENAGLVAASEALLARAASAWYDPGLLDLSEVLAARRRLLAGGRGLDSRCRTIGHSRRTVQRSMARGRWP
ncbi:MAG: hypothetical protein AB7I68_08825 [Porticoccaceae bacterium]